MGKTTSREVIATSPPPYSSNGMFFHERDQLTLSEVARRSSQVL